MRFIWYDNMFFYVRVVNINILLEKAMRKRKMQNLTNCCESIHLKRLSQLPQRCAKYCSLILTQFGPTLSDDFVSVVEFKTLICWVVRGAMSGTTVLVLP